MSEEERELLARIGQLAGQINRHKNRQAGAQPVPNQHPAHHRNNVYRHSSAPYPPRGHRVGRPPTVHRHRTLQLNSPKPTDGSPADSPASASGWVSKTDRHRQLINANVYEKKTNNRNKAIEETRQRKLNDRRRHEKTQFNNFLKHQTQTTASGPTKPGSSVGRNEILVQGIRFRVMDGGKKLVKVADDPNPASATPKSTIIAGVKFRRTKTGNFVVNRIVKDHRRSGVVKKVNEPCRTFSTTGSCPKGPSCRYIHDPDKVALCKDMLKDGKCVRGDSCDLSHDMTPERVPNCLHFAKGHCTKFDCPYTHSRASPGAPVCRAFGLRGYCEKGADCDERHVFECPDFSNTGRCRTVGCKLLHRERASVLRSQARADDAEEDVTSDEDAANSDDVDSDEVAEFIEADSDASDFEDAKDFIPL